MTGRAQLDALVRGPAGFTDNVVEGRVFHVSQFGWVALWAEGQYIINEGRFEVTDDPRPLNRRADVPARLQR